MDGELFAVEGRPRAWPGLESTPAVIQIHRRPGKIHAAVFAGKDGGKRGPRLILRARRNGARFELSKGFHHEVGAHFGEQREKVGRESCWARWPSRAAAGCRRCRGLHRGAWSWRRWPASPLATAHWIGAAPRYFGNREACRFRQPKRGRPSIQGGMMRP